MAESAGTVKATILVIDDDPDLCALLHAVLGARHRVLDCRDGEEGLELARTLRPDAILLDWELPGANGLLILEQLQTDPQLARIPVLIVTARQGIDESVAAFELGATDFVRKPFSTRELRARVEALLRRTASESDLRQTVQAPPRELGPSPSMAAPTAAEQIAGLLGSLYAGKYRVLDLLGSGATALVFRVEHVLLGHELALKVLRADRQTETQRQRFLREARAISRLKHPGIVPVRDFGVLNGHELYLVLDLCPGRTLADELRGKGRLAAPRAVEIVRQLLAALSHAHTRGVVHRDLKPENVVFTDPDLQQVAILDFGLATLHDDTEANLTRPGTMLGTPLYMCPEQVVGGVCDNRSDLYAVGGILYELLSGAHPHNGPTLEALVRSILMDPPTPLSDHLTVSPSLEAVVHRALEKDRQDRFESADQFETALSKAFSDREREAAADA